MDLDDQFLPPMHLAHPFAASVKANRAPPQRELGRFSYQKPSTVRDQTYPMLERPKKKFRADREDPIDFSQDEDMTEPTVSTSYAYQDPEMAIWDMALTKVVDSGHGAVSLRYSQTSLHFGSKKN